MELSDIIALVNIAITIIVGFYLTRLYGIRDTRTRSLKDYYINQAKDIQIETQKFFSRLMSGHVPGRELTPWFKSHKTRFTSFDDGISTAFDINYIRISDILFEVHKSITRLEEFNNGFSDGHFNFSNESRKLINTQEERAISAINNLVLEVNNASPCTWIRRLVDRAKYYCSNGSKTFLQLVRRVFYFIIRMVFYALLLYGLYELLRPCYANYVDKKNKEELKRDSLINEAFSIMRTQTHHLDSIDNDLQQIKEKMRIRKGVVNHYIHTKCISDKTDNQEDSHCIKRTK